MDTELIRFGMWLEKWGWEFYDCEDRMIHFPSREVVLIKDLFGEFKKENPEP